MYKVSPASRIACAAILFMAAACQDVPKYKKSSGKFDEWQSYEGKHFEPSSGTVTAIDPAASTISISSGRKAPKTYAVTSQTRLIHEGDDITLAEFPVKTEVKYTLSDDGKQLLTVWYGHRLIQHRPQQANKARNSYF